jgi:glycerol transport system permease protein
LATERQNLLAYTHLAPALVVLTLTGLVPLGFVAFYSVHDVFAGNDFVWVGTQWFQQVLTSRDFHAALLKSLLFALMALAIQIPLGILVALQLPAKGWLANAAIIIMCLPLLTPMIVVGYLWKAMTLPKAGLIFEALAAFGLPLNLNSIWQTWAVLAVMDAWHWTSLVVLLCYAGLRAIPDSYYRAASIDGASRWGVFRHIQLPRLKLVLLIAVLLRFMDSFMIYTEAYVVTRGGPRVSTTFLSHELFQTANIQFDLGEGGAMAVIYFAIIFIVAAIFFRLIVPPQLEKAAR